MLLTSAVLFSQNSAFWKKENSLQRKTSTTNLQKLPDKEIYHLDILKLKKKLLKAPLRNNGKTSELIIPFPNSKGKFENYRIYEAPVLHPDLAAKYPNIKSYAGTGVDNPLDKIRFSISPQGIKSMRLGVDKPAVFIEPFSKDLQTYTIYERSDKPKNIDGFNCSVNPKREKSSISGSLAERNADDGILRSYRIAISATGEYTTYHGGTRALALAAMNASMTRVNGIFETDFNVTMVIIPNNDSVIYTNAATDPYTGNFNLELQSTLTNVIGEANYDIGHLFTLGSNNGNAGCIGCVCVNGRKGSGYSSHSTPEGDAFDVDLIAHEIGHQFGANHTWTHGRNEGTNTQVEPGSGSTIMSYAGITGNTDVQTFADPYFHAVSIQQVMDYVRTTGCQTNIPTGNITPTANAGINYTIPKGTPFVLTGVGMDADAGDVLSYTWEQMDENDSRTTYPNVNEASGVAFRSYPPSSSPSRYFPNLEVVKDGETFWGWEAIPNVSRDLNFRFTVRDNRIGGGSNNSDDMRVTVNDGAGPFITHSPNTNVALTVGTTETITWSVAGTTENGINVDTVDILLSTDGGNTYPVTLASDVPNDGAHDVIIPNNIGNENRVMVKGHEHIFFDISNENFTIINPQTCTNAGTVPTGVRTEVLENGVGKISWDEMQGAAFVVEYKVASETDWIVANTSATTIAVANLENSVSYEIRVKSICNGTESNYSDIVTLKTYCYAAGRSRNDDHISNITLNTINNNSNGQLYSNFTDISTTITKGVQETINITPTWVALTYPYYYTVWIDYNQDGDFSDNGETVWSSVSTRDATIIGNFTVPQTASVGTTAMRVMMNNSPITSSCGRYDYGEVEDYTVNIIGGTDAEVPVLTLLGADVVDINLGDSYLDAGATAIDNVDGDISNNILVTGTVDTTIGGTYTLTYNVSDAAGNAAVPLIRTINVSTSLCVNGVNNYPYIESFDSSFGLWTQNSNDDIDWSRNEGTTETRGTGPSRALDGSHYIYVEASGKRRGYPNKRAILTSPCFDLSGLTSASLSFQYHMYGAKIGKIKLEVSEDDGATWASIWDQKGNKGNKWLQVSIDLNSYLNKAIRLRFNRTTGKGPKADVAIDKLELKTISTTTSKGNQQTIPDADLSIYPNPVIDRINIVNPVDYKSIDYVIYNTLGQVVKRGVATSYIDVNSLKSSIYILSFKEEDQIKNIKFVKK